MAGVNYPTPSSTISAANLNTALGQSTTAAVSLGDSRLRFLANQDSGAVSMGNMRNKYYWDGATSSVQSDIKDPNITYAVTNAPYPFGAVTSFNDSGHIIYGYTNLSADSSTNKSDIVVGYYTSTFLTGRNYRLWLNGRVVNCTATTMPRYPASNPALNYYQLYAYNGSGQVVIPSMIGGGPYTYRVASY